MAHNSIRFRREQKLRKIKQAMSLKASTFSRALQSCIVWPKHERAAIASAPTLKGVGLSAIRGLTGANQSSSDALRVPMHVRMLRHMEGRSHLEELAYGAGTFVSRACQVHP